VPPGKIIPSNALAMGVPVKIRENAVAENIFEEGVQHYLHLCDLYKRTLKKIN
jgi:carbonic anhydrase/acetyltransferase-like protein (isoleucine patch superfamily)